MDNRSCFTKVLTITFVLAFGSSCLLGEGYKKNVDLERILNADDVSSFIAYFSSEKDDSSDQNGSLLLVMAIEKRAPSIAKYLIGEGVGLEPENNDCRNPLVVASYVGLNEIVNGLIAKGMDSNTEGLLGVWKTEETVFPQGKIYVSPLMAASMGGRADTVSILLKDGAEVNCANTIGKTALHYAVVFRNSSMIVNLLESGANVNALDARERSPLEDAIFYGNLQVIELLLKNGARVESLRKGVIGTLARECCKEGNVDKIEILLSNPEFAEVIKEWAAKTAEHRACPGCLELLKIAQNLQDFENTRSP